MPSRQVWTGVCGALLVILGLAGCSGRTPPPPGREVRSLETLDAAGLMRLAANFRRAGDREAAMRFYREAAARAPDDPAPLLAIAEMLGESGDVPGAATVLARARAIAPGDSAVLLASARFALQQDRPSEALEDVAALRRAGLDSADLYNIEAVALDLDGRHAEAVRAFAEALVRRPDDSVILSNLALSLAAAGEIAAARDILEGLLEDAATRPVALENLALVLALSGDLAAAEEAARAVLPPSALASNRRFYRRLATLAPADRPRAVFLGILPPETAVAAMARGETQQAEETRSPAAAAPAAGPVPPRQKKAAADIGPPRRKDEAAPLSTPDAAAAAPEQQPDAAAVAVADAAAAETGRIPDEKPAEPAASQVVATDQAESSQPPAAETAPPVAAAREAIPFYHLQIGSFSSLARARLGWQRLSTASDALAGEVPALESVTLAGGQEMHRLLLGPIRGFRAARARCATLMEAGLDCVVIPERTAATPLSAAKADPGD